jgi:hypothetical protein
LKTFVLLMRLAGLTLACEEPRPPTVVFQYVVRGSGDDVKVTYLTEEAGLVERTVNLSWTSEEFRGTKQSPVHIEADGPPGSTVECVVRYRPQDGTYGGNGSGFSGAKNDPGEDQTACILS